MRCEWFLLHTRRLVSLGLCERQKSILTGHAAISTRATKPQKLQPSFVPSPQTSHTQSLFCLLLLSLGSHSGFLPTCNHVVKCTLKLFTSGIFSNLEGRVTQCHISRGDVFSVALNTLTQCDKLSQGRASPPRTLLVRTRE